MLLIPTKIRFKPLPTKHDIFTLHELRTSSLFPSHRRTIVQHSTAQRKETKRPSICSPARDYTFFIISVDDCRKL